MLLEVNLTNTECCFCGVIFAIPSTMHDNKRERGGFFHCPNGHSIGWGEDKIEKKLKETERNLDGYKKRNASLADQVSCLEGSNRGLKAANTRLKNAKKSNK